MELCVHWEKAIPRFIDDFNLFKDPPNYYLTFPDISVGSSITGGGYVFIGAAIQGWKDNSFVITCPQCKKNAYILRIGALLSGDGYCKALCPTCGIVKSHEGAMSTLLKSAIHGKWNRTLGYKPIVQKEDPYHFSIKEGLTRTGNKDEIRMDVPGWLEFMQKHYPDCLCEARTTE